MGYKFPTIRTIDDVLPAIAGRDEFIVAERDYATIINYVVMAPGTFDIDMDDTFENDGEMIPKGAMRRECRGLMFAPDGKIMSRSVHKFFNIGEREETLPGNIDFGQPHRILIKEDGSMVRPFLVNGFIRWGTKMGLSDVAMLAETFVAANPKYNDFAAQCIAQNLTPVFEFVGPNNRIVIDYAEQSMILLAIRHNITGEYTDIHA
jgi:RNA ligase